MWLKTLPGGLSASGTLSPTVALPWRGMTGRASVQASIERAIDYEIHNLHCNDRYNNLRRRAVPMSVQDSCTIRGCSVHTRQVIFLGKLREANSVVANVKRGIDVHHEPSVRKAVSHRRRSRRRQSRTYHRGATRCHQGRDLAQRARPGTDHPK